jgi:hypothetical protein
MKKKYSRRQFIKSAALTTAGLSLGPYIHLSKAHAFEPMKRSMGRLNFEATTLSLGAQASLQWTPAGVDPVKIILKAFDSGIDYYDTSNFYDDSQLNYGKAFRKLHLIPGQPGYSERLRRSFQGSDVGLADHGSPFCPDNSPAFFTLTTYYDANRYDNKKVF